LCVAGADWGSLLLTLCVFTSTSTAWYTCRPVYLGICISEYATRVDHLLQTFLSPFTKESCEFGHQYVPFNFWASLSPRTPCHCCAPPATVQVQYVLCIQPRWPNHRHTFSAFWLRSSVVSVLISLISDSSLIDYNDIKLICCGWHVVPPSSDFGCMLVHCPGLPCYCTTGRLAAQPILGVLSYTIPPWHTCKPSALCAAAPQL
jgi:hypothetical protein